MYRLLLLSLVVFSNTAASLQISTKQFDRLKLVSTKLESNAFQFPAVLMYDVTGNVMLNLNGSKISSLSSYTSMDKTTSISSLNVHEISNILGIAVNRKKPTLMFVSFEICPPCEIIEGAFNDKIKSKLTTQYNFISIKVMDK